MTGGRKDRGTKFLQIALFGAVAAFVACGCCSAARAGDDDVQNKTFGDKVMDAIGLHNPFDTQYEINYGERSPLVVPPTRDLPSRLLGPSSLGRRCRLAAPLQGLPRRLPRTSPRWRSSHRLKPRGLFL